MTDVPFGDLRPPRGRIPFVAQLEAADCGAACLAMVLGQHGHEVRLSDLREELGGAAVGVNAGRLLDVAARHGMVGRGVRVGLEHLRRLPRGSILHWELAHFVVLDRVGRNGVRVLDPSSGRREVSWDELRRAFTGFALVLSPTEGFVKRRVAKGRVTPYLRRLFSDAALLGRVLAMSLLLQVMAMAIPALTGVVVDQVVPRADVDLLWVVAGGALFAVLFSALATLVRAHLLVGLRTRLDMTMTVDFIRHLVSLPYAYFQHRPAGDLMMRVNSNAIVREFLTSNVLSGLLDACLVSLYVLVIASVSLSMAGLVLGLGILRVLLLFAVRRSLADLVATQLDAQARSQAYLAQLLAGIETLKAAGAERRSVSYWSNLYGRELNAVALRARLRATVESLLQVLTAGSPVLVLTLGTILVLQGSHTLGSVLAVVAFANAFFGPLSALVESGLQLSALGSYLDRMDDVLSAAPEQPSTLPAAPPLRGGITLQNVSFRYRPDAPPAVDRAQLEILPGQTVAIVGASGSGKSTLARLLLGLHCPTEGRILFDGQDISGLDAVSVRRQIGVVPQAPYLFASSIRENIALSDPSAPLPRVIEAARQAGIHDDIARLPLRYDTPLADRGESLSGGQRQRIAIARAILTRPAILLLDEATSALDAQTELQVTTQLDRMRCTRVVVAHRLSTIAQADVIVVMHDGQIVEAGHHDELMARGPIYRALVSAQSRLSQG